MRPTDSLTNDEVLAVLNQLDHKFSPDDIEKKITVAGLAKLLGVNESSVAEIAGERRLIRMMDYKVVSGPKTILLTAIAVLCVGAIFTTLMISAGGVPGSKQKTHGSSTALPSGDPNIIRVQP